MNELFKQHRAAWDEWQSRKISDFDFIRRQCEIIKKIETLYHESPAYIYYNAVS